jgi:Kef-type K+ transport system membrane component KefB/mannitol/fructose-specific phosphotransferase system IIA component (Ntr-type)
LFFDAPPYQYPFIDPVLIFACVMFLLALVPIIADWLKAPRIVFYIIGGAIAGPHVLNFLHRDETMVLLGTVGLIYLIFLAGLQLDLNKFIKYKYQSLSFGFLTFLLPFGIGTALGLWLGYSIFTALLLASLFASHTLVAYPIISRLGITKNKAMTTSVGGIIVTDPGALLVLAVVVGAHSGDISTAFWLMLTVSVASYLAIIYFIIPVVGQWFFRNSKSGGAVEYGFVIAILFLCAWLADVAGLEPIIGAFLAGLALNRLIPEKSVLMNRTKFIGEALFIPFFLLSVGMLVDISAFFTDIRTWVIAGAMIAAVVIGKGGAAYFSQFIFKFSKSESWTIFGLTVPQAAATLAVTLIAYDIGLFDDYILNGTIMMILVTCLIGPYVVEKFGKQVALAEDREPYDPSEAPQRILVPLANPETSDALMDIAFMVRDTGSEEPVYPLTVARGGTDVESQVARGEKMLSHAVIHAASAETPVVPVTRVDFNVSKGITRAVDELRISNVVIGWNGEISTRQRIFGSILDRLLEEIDEMVMVCKVEAPVNTFERMVLAIPPLASLETGFAGAIRSLKLMAEQIGGDMVIVSTDEKVHNLRERVIKVKPETPLQFKSIDSWIQLPGWIEMNRRDNDLLVILSAREGTLSWRPGLDRLPRVISQRYPKLSFVTVYPSEAEIERDHQTGEKALKLLREDRVKLYLEDGLSQEVLEQILKTDENLNEEKIDSIVRRLLENSADYKPEVMPGVLLFETHTSKANNQKFFIGISKDGVNVEQSAHPVHIVMILVSPKEMSADDHLRGLNSVVRLIRPGEIFEKIKNAENTTEVISTLKSLRQQNGQTPEKIKA